MPAPWIVHVELTAACQRPVNPSGVSRFNQISGDRWNVAQPHGTFISWRETRIQAFCRLIARTFPTETTGETHDPRNPGAWMLAPVGTLESAGPSY